MSYFWIYFRGDPDEHFVRMVHTRDRKICHFELLKVEGQLPQLLWIAHFMIDFVKFGFFREVLKFRTWLHWFSSVTNRLGTGTCIIVSPEHYTFGRMIALCFKYAQGDMFISKLHDINPPN